MISAVSVGPAFCWMLGPDFALLLLTVGGVVAGAGVA
jgi:hypothetical protein